MRSTAPGFVRAAACGAAVLFAVSCGGDGGAEAAPEGSPGAAIEAALEEQAPAVAPFEGMGVIEVRVGDELLSVVVADEPGERSDGLRGRTDPAPYDGMLFVHESDTTTSFTMSGVDEPLDLAFYDADGERRGGHDLEPCPDRLDCPTYSPDLPWRYALETRAGELPDGPLRAP